MVEFDIEQDKPCVLRIRLESKNASAVPDKLSCEHREVADVVGRRLCVHAGLS